MSRFNRGPEGAPKGPRRFAPRPPPADLPTALPEGAPRLVCGLQAVREAVRAHGRELGHVYVERDGGPQLDALARFAADQGANVSRLGRDALDHLAHGARHQGVVAYARPLAHVALETLDVGPGALLVALDELEDPQNFGAILRSAVAFGAAAVIYPEHHAAPLTPATFRASAGAVEHARLCKVASLPTALETLAARGATVVGLDADAPESLADVAADGAVVVVVGAEGKGLRKGVKRACTALARLPMSGPLGSLNASVACGVALYEIARRRPPAP